MERTSHPVATTIAIVTRVPSPSPPEVKGDSLPHDHPPKGSLILETHPLLSFAPRDPPSFTSTDKDQGVYPLDPVRQTSSGDPRSWV